MNRCLLLALALFAACPTKATAQKCYDLAEVRRWVEIEPPGVAPSTRQIEGQINGMGDRISVAILHSFTDKELHDRSRINRIIPILQTAFECVDDCVVESQDREPRVTLLLIGVMQERAPTNLKRRLAKLRRYMENKQERPKPSLEKETPVI
jgi:hypothetical protein